MALEGGRSPRVVFISTEGIPRIPYKAMGCSLSKQQLTMGIARLAVYQEYTEYSLGLVTGTGYIHEHIPFKLGYKQ